MTITKVNRLSFHVFTVVDKYIITPLYSCCSLVEIVYGNYSEELLPFSLVTHLPWLESSKNRNPIVKGKTYDSSYYLVGRG